jgi:hypothetical protein
MDDVTADGTDMTNERSLRSIDRIDATAVDRHVNGAM